MRWTERFFDLVGATFALHCSAQFRVNLVHPFFGTMKTQCASQRFASSPEKSAITIAI
jgi:hypothetical protein